jgi:hypothetical protein
MLSRDALERRLAIYVTTAVRACPSLREKTITLHVLRHYSACGIGATLARSRCCRRLRSCARSTLVKGTELVVHVRFRGGATRTLTLPRPAPAWALRQTSPEVVAEIDRLLADYTDVQIARILTERGFRSGTGKPVNIMMVARVRDHYHLAPRYERLRQRGLLTLDEVADVLGISTATAKQWRLAGLLRAHAYNDKNQYLYERPGPDASARYKWKEITQWKCERRSGSHPTDEVQYEA